MPFKKKTYSLKENSLKMNEYYSQTLCIPGSTEEEINKELEKRKKNIFWGFFCASLSGVLYVLLNAIIKKLSYISPGQLSFVFNAGIFAISLPIAVASQENIIGTKETRLVLVARSIIGTTGLYLNVLTHAFLPLADAAIIMSTVPAVTMLFARIYLRESFSLTQSVVLVITLCGVFLSVRLPELLQKRSNYQFDHNYISGLATAVGSVITLSFTFIILRKLKDVHFCMPMLYFGAFGMIENAIINGITLSYSPVDCGWDQFLYMSTAIVSFLSNATMTLALKFEEAGIVTVVRASSEIIAAIISQIIIFKSCPDLYNIGGGFLVILSLSILGIRNWLLNLPENSEPRKKLKYFLI